MNAGRGVLARARAAGPWPAVCGALLLAALVGGVLSLVAVSAAASQADRLSGRVLPLGQQVAALDGAVNEMDGALRTFLASGAEAQLAPYRAAQPRLDAASRAAQAAAKGVGDGLPDPVKLTTKTAAVWQRDGADPAIARRLSGGAPDAALAARADALLADYRAAAADLRPRVRQEEQAARAALSHAEAFRGVVVSVTVACAGLALLLAGAMGVRRLRRRFAALRLEAQAGSVTRDLLNGMRDAVLVIDPATQHVRDVNVAAERLSGRSRAALTDLLVADLAASASDRGIAEAVGAALKTGDAADPYRLTWVQPNGCLLYTSDAADE